MKEQWQNKQIIIGVTGGIAAYKVAELTRMLCNCGAVVKVVMTEYAMNFISPLTFQSLSGNVVYTNNSELNSTTGMLHIELARWADMVIIVPATADFIAQMVTGQGGNLLSLLCLATEAKIFVVPAMNSQMWNKQVTQYNVKILQNRDIVILGPDYGEQACGEYGYGRMMEPGNVLQDLVDHLPKGVLSGKQVLITAGPTREFIDPVRFISNRSSGKMGFHLAQVAMEAGALVTLIAGSVNLCTPCKVRRIDVESTLEMYEAVHLELEKFQYDLFIGVAAVADFCPKYMQKKKIKKDGLDKYVVDLVKTIDIIKTVGELSFKRPYTAGFCAEDGQSIENALAKMKNKKMDMIIANDISRADIGFNSDYNEVEILYDKQTVKIAKIAKKSLALQLINIIAEQMQLKEKKTNPQ